MRQKYLRYSRVNQPFQAFFRDVAGGFLHSSRPVPALLGLPKHLGTERIAVLVEHEPGEIGQSHSARGVAGAQLSA
jgi:hypothetical protein